MRVESTPTATGFTVQGPLDNGDELVWDALVKAKLPVAT